jgi:hypothetical protein
MRTGKPLPKGVVAGQAVNDLGNYYAADGTFMNANGTRSIFDDVDDDGGDDSPSIAQHGPMRIGDVINVRIDGHPEPVPMQSIHLDQPMNAGGGIALVAMRGCESDSLVRLFVTSPELLAACKEALRDLIADGHSHYRVADQLREVIAKATGCAA